MFTINLDCSKETENVGLNHQSLKWTKWDKAAIRDLKAQAAWCWAIPKWAVSTVLQNVEIYIFLSLKLIRNEIK